jgi:hypothetical protein
MSGLDKYDLYIDAFSPATIPMARLSEYMKDFAKLLGQERHVHFAELCEGSLAIRSYVDEEARSKVESRLEEVRLGLGPKAAQEALLSINSRLAEDHAVGWIQRGSARVIEFAGRNKTKDAEIGPIMQPGSLDGEIVQIGGKDDSINIHLRMEDSVYRCITTKVIARQLAPHIFESTVRLYGIGHWWRSDSGQWFLKHFDIDKFEILDDKTSLTKVFSRLREQLVPPESGRQNPIDLMLFLREE